MIKDLFARLTFGRTVILGLSLTAIYYFMFYDSGASQQQAISTQEQEMQNLNTQIQEVQTKLDRANEFQSATKQLGASISRLLEFIPSNFKSSEFMKVVSQEARVAGLEIQTVAPAMISEGSKIPEFNELGVTVELKGQYSQLLKFMSSMTQKKQIFVYERIKLSRVGEGEVQNGMITANLEIRAYDYVGAAAAAPVNPEGGEEQPQNDAPPAEGGAGE